MKALYFTQHGEIDVITYRDVRDAAPGRGEVLVRVRACAINHLDIWVGRGWPGLKLEMPHWCGADVAGESVLVVGAGGGVNSMAIQIAKLAGAVVYVVCGNEEKGRRALDLGADHVLDRSRLDWAKELHRMTGKRGVDVVVDNVGRATIAKSMQAN